MHTEGERERERDVQIFLTLNIFPEYYFQTFKRKCNINPNFIDSY